MVSNPAEAEKALNEESFLIQSMNGSFVSPIAKTISK